MGACFGRCLAIKKRFGFQCSSNDDLSENLVENNNHEENDGWVYRIMKTKRKKHSKFIDRFWNRREIKKNYSRLSRNNTSDGSEIQLQCLDARSLLITSKERGIGIGPDLCVNTSPLGSSLDLEWEHEYGSNESWLALPEDVTINELSSEDDCSSSNKSDAIQSTATVKIIARKDNNKNRTKNYCNNKITATSASWSHISTPDSLEWDIDQDQQFKSEEDSLDQETKDLLYEIERLKNRVLSETGVSVHKEMDTTVES